MFSFFIFPYNKKIKLSLGATLLGSWACYSTLCVAEHDMFMQVETRLFAAVC